MTPSFRGFVDEQGRLSLRKPERFRAHLQSLKSREVVVTVAREVHSRTLAQNRYYFGPVLGTIEAVTGHTKEELHEIFKAKFLAREVQFLNRDIQVIPSTTSLDTVQFTEYVDKVMAWAAEYGIEIPAPGDMDIAA